jgi:hypothetical protein
MRRFGHLTASRGVEYLSQPGLPKRRPLKEEEMALLIRKYKLTSGMTQEERIDDPDRIERYMRLFEKDDIKKLQTGQKVWIEKDEWQLLP